MAPAPGSRTAGDLTPEQHAAIRQQLILIPVYIWIAYMWWMFFMHLPVGASRIQEHASRDFVHFYTQGAIARMHDAHALYDIDAMAAVVTRVVPVPVHVRFPPVYGPHISVLFAPLASVDYVTALRVWLAFTLIGYGVCMYAVWRECRSLHRYRWSAVMLAVGAPGLHFALSFGQISVLGLCCFTALWLALRHDRPWLAGLAVGALAYKPQLGVVAAFVFVLRGQWRVVGGALAAVLVQALAGLLYWGPSIYVGYTRALRALPALINGMEPDKSLMHSWRGLFLHLGLSPELSVGLTVAVSAITILLVVRSWRADADLRPRYVLLVVATLLVNAHMYAYDLLLLGPALLIAWDWASDLRGTTVGSMVVPWSIFSMARLDAGLLAAALTMFVYASPIMTIALPTVPIQWAVVAFLTLGAMLVVGLRHDRSAAHA